MELVECVANFSAGKDKSIIDSIVSSIRSIDNIYLLGVDIGLSANRTVVSFAGPPQSVLDAAFESIRVSTELIEMQNHTGTHPRIGACDVCPIVPLSDNIETCKEVATKLAKMVGDKLKVPVYLYGLSASTKRRTDLAYIRRGEYEGLLTKMSKQDFKPDFGPSTMNLKSGATAIGVRNILVAYNVSLDTKDLESAKEIAKMIRANNKMDLRSGKIPHRTIKAIAWFIDEYNCCQVSMNLLDYKLFSMKKAYDLVDRLAAALDIRLLGSELVGLAPLAAFLDNPSNNKVVDSKQIDIEVESIGLSYHYPFDKNEKIIEYKIEDLEKSIRLSR